MREPLRVWNYARVSTRKKSQAHSPRRQLGSLRLVAKLKGWRVVGEGYDRISGATSERPELARALEAIRTGRANVLAVQDLDRLGGDMRQIIDTAKLIDDCGGNLFIESLQIDTTQGGPIGRYVFHIMAAFAELRRTFQNEKIVRGIEAARRRGRRLGRPRSHFPSRRLLARAAELLALGRSWRAICAELRAEGFKSVPPHPTLRRAVLAAAGGRRARAAAAAPPGGGALEAAA